MTGLDARLVVERSPKFSLDIDLRCEPDSTLALLGPNGAGKSTAVWALAGIIPIDEGHISLDGRMLDDPTAGVRVAPEHRRIGPMFQDVLLFPHLTVAGNVAFAFRASTATAKEARQSAADLLHRFGLEGLAGLKPANLSGGQAQQVGLARALAGQPEMLLLDEPLSALDVAARAQVRRMLAEHLASFEGPRLLITHDPAEAMLLADRVVVVEHGSVTQTGTPDEILRAPRTSYAADLAGLNLLAGSARDGEVGLESGPAMQIADRSIDGDVLLIIHPKAVAIHAERPTGSPRNTWRSRVATVETLGDLCRVQFGHPIPLTATVTTASRRSLGLAPGREVWVAVKAAEVEVLPG